MKLVPMEVICSLEAFMQIKELAGEAADALENDVEIPIYDQGERIGGWNNDDE